MQKKKLNKFIILSFAFHVILISAVLLYFLKNPLTGGKSGTKGTVLVGVISNEDLSEDKSSSSAQKTNNQTRNQKSNPKVALERKPVKQQTKEQTTPKEESQNATIKTVKVKTDPSKSINSASALKDSEKNNTKTGSEIASSGQKGKEENKDSGKNGYKDALAYPDYSLNPKPKYPRVARKRGYEGEVKLKVFVLADGRVGKIELLRPSGHKVLDDEAIEAVKDWIFFPGKQDGKEISSWVTVPIMFQLNSG